MSSTVETLRRMANDIALGKFDDGDALGVAESLVGLGEAGFFH